MPFILWKPPVLFCPVLRWLAENAYKKYRLARNLGWNFYVRNIYKTDDEIFAKLPSLYAEFLRTLDVISFKNLEEYQREDPYSIYKLISLFCRRPKMLFSDGSFNQMSVYIDGFADGCRGDTKQELISFRQWVAEKPHNVHLARDLHWSSYVRNLYPADEEIWEKLAGLYAEFLNGRSDVIFKPQ
jgi:hypothetical protein